MFLKNYFLFTVWFRRGDFTALRSMLNVFVHQIRFFGVNITISMTAPAAIGAVRLLVRNFRIHSAKNERTMFFSTLRPKKFEKLSSEKKTLKKLFSLIAGVFSRSRWQQIQIASPQIILHVVIKDNIHTNFRIE